MWDLDVDPPAPSDAPASPEVEDVAEPAETIEPVITEPAPTEPEPELSTDDEQPSLPDVADGDHDPVPGSAAVASRSASIRTRNRIGLASVVIVAALMVVAALWFVRGDADNAGRADSLDAVSPPTLPAVAPSLNAVSSDADESPEPELPADDVFTGEEAPSGNLVTAEEVPVQMPIDDVVGETAPDQIDGSPGQPGAVPAEPEPDEVVIVELEPVEPLDDPVADVPTGPWIEIVARTEPCRFGSNCLVAGYVAHGFDTVPGSFTCEFASGSRFEFRATTAVVDHACATGSIGDSITVEIEGVRSETVAHD